MRAIVAVVGALTSLAIGIFAISTASSETAGQSGTAGDVHTLLNDTSAVTLDATATALPWMGVAAIVLIAAGVLVAAGRGR